MFENLCSLPLQADVLALAIHPTESILAVGLSNGHVEAFQLPAKTGTVTSSDSDDEAANANTSVLSDGRSTVESLWKTRRHKGSCRCLAYSLDGKQMYSAGSDGILKHFDSSTGEVITKMAVPLTGKKTPDHPCLVHVLNPQKLLLACDSGAQHIIDLSNGKLGRKPTLTVFPHEDYVSAVVPLPPTDRSTSGYPKQWVSTGGTTLSIIDARSGIVTRSDDQEDELLCAAFVPGLGPKNNRNLGVVAVGMGSGVVTMWDKGAWDDQQERIIVDGGRAGGESIDAMVLIPEKLRLGGKKLIVAVGDGTMRGVDLSRREVMGQELHLRHDDMESIVVALGFDIEGRLISAGGTTIKVWQLSELEDRGKGDAELAANGPMAKKRMMEDSDEEDSDDGEEEEEEEEDSSEEDERPKRKGRKRQKLTKGKGKKKLDAYGHHGVMKFDNL